MDRAEIVTILNKIKVSIPGDEAEGACTREGQPRNARLYLWRSRSLKCLAYLYYCIASISYDQGSLQLIEQKYILNGLEHGTW